MLTVCTACGTQFRVSTAQLRAVHGLVRCSRCQSVFDAFETLQEEFAPLDVASPAPPLDELGALAEELSRPEGDGIPVIPANLAAHPAAATEPDIHLEAAEPKPDPEDLFAEVWGESAAEEPGDPLPLAPSRPEPVLIEDHIPKPRELELDQTLYRHKDLPPRERGANAAKTGGPRLNIWGIGAILLVLVLAAQVVNAHRLELSRTPVIGMAVSGLYAALGHPLAAPPAPSTWQISSTNVTSDPETPGALSITGTLANHADFAQSWPVLRVELTDRDGNPLRARDFSAGEYLPANRAATWLGPGMAAQFRIDVVDPGADAVGFTVLPCVGEQNARTCSSADNGSN